MEHSVKHLRAVLSVARTILMNLADAEEVLGACTFLLQTCPHPWHRTRPLLAGVGPNPHTNTHLNCQLCPPRSKPGAVQFAWLISISSRRPKISLRLWSPLSQVECANCIGIQTHLNGSTTLAVGGA